MGGFTRQQHTPVDVGIAGGHALDRLMHLDRPDVVGIPLVSGKCGDPGTHLFGGRRRLVLGQKLDIETQTVGVRQPNGVPSAEIRVVVLDLHGQIHRRAVGMRFDVDDHA
ncbi:Uncharacterised protein [Mycobacteroides abscessus]|nr:Uncharacterised protein [Mycobacteroides abscessus]